MFSVMFIWFSGFSSFSKDEAQVFVQGITEMLRDNPSLSDTEMEAQCCVKSAL